MVAIIDYGVGNLFSLNSSLKAIGIPSIVTGKRDEILSADRLILPGVGAFGDAAEKLFDTGLGELIISEAGKGKPLLGICLGMQLLFDKSYEFGEYKGLGLIPGEVVPMRGVIPDDLKIPHIKTKTGCLRWPIRAASYISSILSMQSVMTAISALPLNTAVNLPRQFRIKTFSAVSSIRKRAVISGWRS